MTLDLGKEALASFLQAPIEEVEYTLLEAGLDENSVLKGTYQEKSYVVKCFNSASKGICEIAWTKHANDLGIGALLYDADLTGRYLMMEFVEGRSMDPVLANDPVFLKKLAQNVKKLHQSSIPTAEKIDLFSGIEEKFRALKCEGELAQLLEFLNLQVKSGETAVRSIQVPCHNDLNPRNLFFNKGRVIIVDWGDAVLSNPYYDIATFFVLNIIEEKARDLFLKEYNKELIASSWKEYFHQLEQIVLFEFALNLFLCVQEGGELGFLKNPLRKTKSLSHYLSLFARGEQEVDSAFLYGMGLAALRCIQ